MPVNVKEIRNLLLTGSLSAYRKCGQQLNRIYKGRAAYGQRALEQLSARLRRAGDCACSANLLAKCRSLAIWDRFDVRLAIQRGIPWRAVIKLLAIDGLSRRLESPAQRERFIRKRCALMRRYPRGRVAQKRWRADLGRLRLALLRHIRPTSKAKQLAAVRRAIRLRLNNVRQRLADSRPLIPKFQQDAADRADKRLRRLTKAIYKLLLSAAEQQHELAGQSAAKEK
ncbi:MAG TPA: hypothetical protein VGP72_25790 [Planctomycetota bacterium]|jgi:hypothetical protein